MKICLAQIASDANDLNGNIQKHLSYIDQAIELGADIIAFPELSLSAYAPELIKHQSVRLDDKLQVFQSKAAKGKITIILGRPVFSDAGIKIVAQVFYPNGLSTIHEKCYLHQDEEAFFICGDKSMLIELQGIKILPAICYEAMLPEVYNRIDTFHADIYLAMVAKHEQGIMEAYSGLPSIAKKYDIPVLLVNAVGPSEGFVSAGSSAVWDREGRMHKNLGRTQEDLLCYEFGEV